MHRSSNARKIQTERKKKNFVYSSILAANGLDFKHVRFPQPLIINVINIVNDARGKQFLNFNKLITTEVNLRLIFFTCCCE